MPFYLYQKSKIVSPAAANWSAVVCDSDYIIINELESHSMAYCFMSLGYHILSAFWKLVGSVNIIKGGNAGTGSPGASTVHVEVTGRVSLLMGEDGRLIVRLGPVIQLQHLNCPTACNAKNCPKNLYLQCNEGFSLWLSDIFKTLNDDIENSVFGSSIIRRKINDSLRV